MEKKSLFEMTRREWELLCDGCGRCCLEKLKDHKTGKVYYTDLAWWQPLISGNPETIHSEGISIRGKAVSSIGIPMDEFEKHITPNGIWSRSAGW